MDDRFWQSTCNKSIDNLQQTCRQQAVKNNANPSWYWYVDNNSGARCQVLKCEEDQTRDPRGAKRLRDFSVGRHTDHINRVSSLTNECDVSVPLFSYVTI